MRGKGRKEWRRLDEGWRGLEGLDRGVGVVMGRRGEEEGGGEVGEGGERGVQGGRGVGILRGGGGGWKGGR